ncbi:uncharacterized protein RAG0_05667 [Rhynchosporium agropyri]|uniref:Uncharacterized protein n=1 Tax=Rhynchosporium agropyri TaxID=914238 RepID=A0A1E1KE05_9HELO|nr:uncharacterized protein RAG0_05667 [Rhynchosporium agropyri]
MAVPANFALLPTEVLLIIISHLPGTGDVNAVCKLTSRLHGLFLPEVFDRHVAWAKTSVNPKKPLECLVTIFLHAVKFNSSTLIQELFCYSDIVDFRGFIPGTPFSHHSITYLHFALTMDAPIIASQLMKHGSSSESTLESLSTTYPDLTPLYLSLARPNLLTERELNAALRIACSYALPRATSFLLARGAEARTVSIYGISVLHATLARRARWKFFDEFYTFMTSTTPVEEVWEISILDTAKNLVIFGADPILETASSRVHSCDARCWKSINCDHSAQSPTHLAASSGLTRVVRFLIKRTGLGVLDEKNGEGYTPLYSACVQGNEETALYILRKQCDITNPNPMVREIDGTTALHVACRFALETIVVYLLEHGAASDINREDVKGRTPLHEVLSHEQFGREEEVIATLHSLAKFGADPDYGSTLTPSSSAFDVQQKRMTRLQTPRHLAGKHPFLSVRDLLRVEKQNLYRDWCDEDKKETMRRIQNAGLQTKEVAEVSDVAVKKVRRQTRKQKEKAAVREKEEAARKHEESFPALKTVDAQIGKSYGASIFASTEMPNQTVASEVSGKGRGKAGVGKNKWKKIEF